MLGRFIAGLERYGPLTAHERGALLALPVSLRRYDAGEDLTIEGEPVSHCRVLTEGIAFRHRTFSDGRRQIVAFNLPGELCDLQGLFLPLDFGVTAIGLVDAALIPHSALIALMGSYPHIERALWRMTLIDAAIHREWMVGMGRRSAYARIAHLFCEMLIRSRAAGLGSGDRCRFPINQIHLSDALGLSVVHTNRVLQALRSDGLISLRGGELVVHDWEGLRAAGEFDPAYLHLREPF